MPAVFMTGCFGNVGTNAVRHFLTLNATLQRKDNPTRVHLTCFEKDLPASRANWQQLVKEFGETSFVTIWGDLLNEQQVREAIKNHDAVIHLAAVIPPLAYERPDLARKVNVDATKILLDAAASQPKPPRFVFASSYSVQGPKNPHKSNPLMNGDTVPNPQDAYGSHKVKCEAMVRQYPGEWTICRIGGVTINAQQTLSAGGMNEMSTLLFSVPKNQHRHGVHAADAGRAFAQCAITTNNVSGKVLCIGGDSTWKTTSGGFAEVIFRSFGIGSLPEAAYRKPSPDNDEAFYYEEWMNTTESQALLDFQKHTFQDWENEFRDGIGSLRRSMIRLIAPIVRQYIARGSLHYQYNSKNLPDPLANKTMAEILKTKADA